MTKAEQTAPPFRVARRTRAGAKRRDRPSDRARADEMVAAIRRWHELYGEAPTLADWEPSRARDRGQEWRIDRYESGEWPSTRMVRNHFGTMSAAIVAAGLSPRRRPTRVRRPLQSADSVLEAIGAWVQRYGETPGMADWDPPRARAIGQTWRVERFYEGDWPSVATVRNHFGTLNAAVREAGYEPRPQGRQRRQADVPAPADAKAEASFLVLRVRAVADARRSSDRVALEGALRDLSAVCLNWADRLAA
jgi:hypothetical protein